MKRRLSLTAACLALALLLGACSCQGGGQAASTPSPSADPQPTPSATAGPSADVDPTPTPVESTTPTGPYSTVTYPMEAVNPGSTFTGAAALDSVSFTVLDPDNTAGLSTERHDFAYGAAKDGAPHSITVDNQALFDSFDLNALAWDNKTGEKVLYLTFDCGYAYGTLISDMLDTLAAKNVPAAFFCTLDYLEEDPEGAARMIAEGHTVGNHSTTHPSDCSALTREKLAEELLGVHNYLRVNFGYECQYFRFPAGVYSENALDLVDSLGYRSAFWSIAHADWDPNNQPGVDKSFQTVTSRLHPGAVILLHSTSPDNAAILGDFIDYARAQGYEFRSLDEYPWN